MCRAVVATAACVALAGGAAAHSLLLESVPAAGATVAAPPAHLTLRFNNRIEKRLSRVRLVGASGPVHVLAVLPGQGAEEALVAALPALAPDTYRVEWQVLSTDGHIVSGRFSFRLAGAAAAHR